MLVVGVVLFSNLGAPGPIRERDDRDSGLLVRQTSRARTLARADQASGDAGTERELFARGELRLQLLESSRMRNHAVGALKKFGPLAEKAVLEHLQSTDWQVRLAICQILNDSGTEESLGPLQAVIDTDSQRLVQINARRAHASIQKRLEKDRK